MKQLYGHIFIFLLSALTGFTLQAEAASRQPTVTATPDWVKQLPTRTSTTIHPKEVNDGYHYLQRIMQWNVATGDTYYHNTYKITTEEGVQNNSELNFAYDPNYEKLQLHKVVVWRDGKPLNKLDIKKVKVVQREGRMEQKIFDESLTAILFLEDVRLGDVIEYAATITGKNPVFNDKFFNSFNLQFYDPVDELLVHVVTPQDRKLHYKLYKTTQKPEVATQDGYTTYTWHSRNLKSTPIDEDTPAWYDAYPGVYLSEFANWEQVAQWALPLYDRKEKLSNALLARIDSIRNTYGSDEQRLVAALRFVQDEVRYLGFEAGIGGFKPRSPSEVFASRFGDCKDKSLLLVTMLRELQLEAYPALVNTTSQGQVAHVLPSPYAFNHCIVQVNIWGKKYWYDPTNSQQRGRFDAIALPDYQKALVIKPGTRQLDDVTAPAAGNARVKVQEVFFVKDVGRGDATLEVKTEYYGSDADYQRSRFATTSLKEIEKSFLNYYASSYPDIEVSRALDFIDYPRENKFITLEEYTVKGLWEESEDQENLLTASFYAQVLRGYITTPRISKRTMPMYLNHPLQVEQEVLLHLPESWTVSPLTKEIEDDAFTYSSHISYNSNSNLVTLRYKYNTLKDHVLPEQMAAYVKHQKAMLDDMGFNLTYNKNMVADADGPISWPIVFLVLTVLALACFGAYKLYFYDPLPLRGYVGGGGESIGGWLALVAIGLCLTPFVSLVLLLSNNYFNHTMWQGLLDATSASYSPKLAVILALELVVNVAFLVYNVALIQLFFDRRSSVPRLMVIFYAINFLFPLLQYLTMSALELPLDSSSSADIFRALFVAAIWIPYFNLSHRVKDTFVTQLNRLVKQEDAEEEMVTVVNN